ncbi:hypothetical protein ACFL5O_08995 [Myxococcota bacterium]
MRNWRRAVTGTAAGVLCVAMSAGMTACGDDSAGLDGKGVTETTELPWVVLDAGDPAPTPPDGASLCPPGECNFQTQTGCDQGLACVATLSGNKGIASCKPPGQTPEGGNCEEQTDCAEGLACAGGSCRTLCCGHDWSVCPTGQSCFRGLWLQRDGVQADTGASVCFPVDDCDVFDPDACGEDRICSIASLRADVACMPTGAVATGKPCRSSNDCAREHVCAEERCVKLCRAEEDAETRPCAGENEVCVHYKTNPPGVGQCMTW